MDFGDILDKWERGQPHTRQRDSEFMNKDTGFYSASVRNERVRDERSHLRRTHPDDVLDIHGQTSDQAWLTLDVFFTKARDSGYKKLRVIHGKGNHSQGEAILGRTVREFIEKCPFAGESGHEKAVNGGSGATWVLLKD